MKETVTREIQNIIQDNIIEYSHSPYTNPIVAIQKKDGQVRLCLDAREIDNRTSPGEINESACATQYSILAADSI